MCIDKCSTELPYELSRNKDRTEGSSYPWLESSISNVVIARFGMCWCICQSDGVVCVRETGSARVNGGSRRRKRVGQRALSVKDWQGYNRAVWFEGIWEAFRIRTINCQFFTTGGITAREDVSRLWRESLFLDCA